MSDRDAEGALQGIVCAHCEREAVARLAPNLDDEAQPVCLDHLASKSTEVELEVRNVV